MLIPVGTVTLVRGLRTDRRYAALFALPLLFGLQQMFEGLVWTAGGLDDQVAVARYSLAYMFFSWLAWPVWVPVAVFLIEGSRRKPLFLVMAVLGGMLGGLQYVPYFAHEGWLTVRFLPNAIVYQSTELLDFIIGREGTYVIYMAIVAGSLLLSWDRNVKVFGSAGVRRHGGHLRLLRLRLCLGLLFRRSADVSLPRLDGFRRRLQDGST